MNKLFFNTIYLSNIIATILSFVFIFFAYSFSSNIKSFKPIKLEIYKIIIPDLFLIFQLTIDSLLFIFSMTIILFFLDILFLNLTIIFYK